MRFIPRRLAGVLLDAARHFPAVVVTGPRRAGKTTLFRKLFPKARYVLLEDPDIQGRVRNDPRAFLDELRPPVVFDEIQNTPELFDYVRTVIDTRPRRIILGSPYVEDFGTRLCKPPKVYMGDSRLACYLLGLTSPAEVERPPFLGALFQGFIAAEILKSQADSGMRTELYYFRDQQGLEVDFLVPRRDTKLWLVETKAAKTVRPSMASPLTALHRALQNQSARLIV